MVLIGYLPNSWLDSQWFKSLAMGMIGFINCAMGTIPFIYVGKLAPATLKGMYQYSGVFSCVIVIGQVLANVLTTILNLIIVPKDAIHNTNPLWIATVFAVFTTLSTLLLTDTKKCKLEEDTSVCKDNDEKIN